MKNTTEKELDALMPLPLIHSITMACEVIIRPASAFLHRLTTNHDVSDIEFLVNAGGYLTALVRRELSGQFDYSE